MLKNKINPQRASSSARKLIENRKSPKRGKGKATEHDDEDANDGSKWVKTDSDCKFNNANYSIATDLPISKQFS